jgi:hypothetical protein
VLEQTGARIDGADVALGSTAGVEPLGVGVEFIELLAQLGELLAP